MHRSAKNMHCQQNHGCNPNPNPRGSKPSGIRVTAGCLPQSEVDEVDYRSEVEK